jgi:hypothetical protein
VAWRRSRSMPRGDKSALPAGLARYLVCVRCCARACPRGWARATFGTNEDLVPGSVVRWMRWLAKVPGVLFACPCVWLCAVLGVVSLDCALPCPL